MKFTKMEGLGNDFVVIEGAVPDRHQVAAWCDRRTGVGADGVLHVSLSDRADCVVRMRHWNSDGSPAEMCGNGLRCVARYALDHGLVGASSFNVETPIGVNPAQLLSEGRVRVALGAVEVGEGVTVGGFDYTKATVGNPHAVRFVEDPGAVDLNVVGPRVAGDSRFPDGANVEFVSIGADGNLTMRVWERGAGETRACGTGAVASVAVAVAAGQAKPTATVHLAGGPLLVEIVDGMAWITGPARTVFAGEWASKSRAVKDD